MQKTGDILIDKEDKSRLQTCRIFAEALRHKKKKKAAKQSRSDAGGWPRLQIIQDTRPIWIEI